MTKAAFEKVIGGLDGDGSVVHTDEGQSGVRDQPENVHGWESGGGDGPSQRRCLDSGDDAVAPPLAEAIGGAVLQASGFVVKGPGGVFVEVAGDASKDVPAGGQGSFDEEGHLGRMPLG